MEEITGSRESLNLTAKKELEAVVCYIQCHSTGYCK